ncbi:Thioredoxin domain-containing protein 9-like protein, partial [Cucurbita argyrosperma subsp. sororia]
MAHIANGRDTGNCVSLLRVNSMNSSQSNMLILQESCTDPTVSFVIYAPVDIVAMNVVLNGGDPDYVALLPSGFAILPDGGGGEGVSGGSLLTVAFQILVDSVPTAKLSLGSVATVNNLIACTVERIKASLSQTPTLLTRTIQKGWGFFTSRSVLLSFSSPDLFLFVWPFFFLLNILVTRQLVDFASRNIQEILEKQVLTVAKAVEDKIDDEIAAIDRLDLDDLEALRERRLQQMKKMAEKRSRWISLGHGEYSEIPVEKDFFSIVKASDRVVCHFYRDNWPCKVMDKHLGILAKQHIETRFVKINAEKSPFLAEKLKIVVLPTLALIKNAKVDDYVVGFDELGGTDEFSTEELEERLAKCQVIFYEGESSINASKSNAQTRRSSKMQMHFDLRRRGLDAAAFLRYTGHGCSSNVDSLSLCRMIW